LPGAYSSQWQKKGRSEVALLPLTINTLAEIRAFLRGTVELDIDPSVTEWADDERNRRQIFHQRMLSSHLEGFPYSRLEDLFPYQREGVAFIVANAMHHGGARVLLEDDPRLGKTIQALAAMQILGWDQKPSLIVCNKSLMEHWRAEAMEWTSLAWSDVVLLEGPEPKRAELLAQGLKDLIPLFITNWATLRMLPQLCAVDWSWFVGDEAHKLKNRKSQVSQAAGHVARKAENRLLTSATFAEQGPQDYWSPLHTILPLQFRSYWQFVGHFTETVPDPFAGVRIVGPANMGLFKSRLRTTHLRREAENVSTLPPKVYETIAAPMTDIQRRQYSYAEKDTILYLTDGGEIDIPNTVARLTRLRQLALGVGALDEELWEESGKMDTLAALIEERHASLPVVVFSSFRYGVECASEVLNVRCGLRVATLTAGKDAAGVAHLLDVGAVEAVVASVGVGGVGLNFAASSWTIYLDLPWSSINIRQADERTREPGKKDSVLITVLTSPGTVDDYVARTLRKKMDDLQEIGVVSSVVDYLKRG
jgi:SNF2 family DNA or RNA helicase